MKLKVFLCLLLIPACAPDRPRCEAYHYHRSYPPTLHYAATQAAEKWSAFSNKPVVIENGDPDDYACSFAVVDSPELYAELKQGAGEDFAAFNRNRDGAIFLNVDAWGDETTDCGKDLVSCATWMLMHELAHEGGLGHVEGLTSVMSVGNPTPILDYSPIDRAELEK